MKRIFSPDKRAAACDGKRTFDTYREAEKIAMRPHKGDYARRAYHCPVCHKYHVGSPKPRQARPQRFILDDMQEAWYEFLLHR
jgi:hypothetical protein